MNKINWKQKLSSRKFWAAVVGFVSALLVAFRADEGTISQVSAVITAGGVLIAYIIGESVVDASRGYPENGEGGGKGGGLGE